MSIEYKLERTASADPRYSMRRLQDLNPNHASFVMKIRKGLLAFEAPRLLLHIKLLTLIAF